MIEEERTREIDREMYRNRISKIERMSKIE